MLRIFISQSKHRQDCSLIEKLESEGSKESMDLIKELESQRKKLDSLYFSYSSEINNIRKITIEYYRVKRNLFVLGRKVQKLLNSQANVLVK